ncbi:MAG TPA: hypothetical protein VH855_10850, partial [Acetobacteraceae bacterium]
VGGLECQRGVMRQPRLQLGHVSRVGSRGQGRNRALQTCPVVMRIRDQASQEPGRICSRHIVVRRETGSNPVGTGQIMQPEQRNCQYQIETWIDHSTSGQFQLQLVCRIDRIARPPLRQLCCRKVEAGIGNCLGIVAGARTSQRCAKLCRGLARFFLIKRDGAGMLEPSQCRVLGILLRTR